MHNRVHAFQGAGKYCNFLLCIKHVNSSPMMNPVDTFLRTIYSFIIYNSITYLNTNMQPFNKAYDCPVAQWGMGWGHGRELYDVGNETG